MADHQHKNYTASDIEKYHHGQLTPAEMHAMEKAALDDPMLADALEGFSIVDSTSVQPGLQDLQERLNQRITKEKDRQAPVVPFYKKNWFRVAAMFIVFAGMGLLIYQFAINQKETNIAVTEKTEEAPFNTTDTSFTTTTPTESDSIPVASGQQDLATAKNESSEATSPTTETVIKNDLDNKVAGLDIQNKNAETEIAAQSNLAKSERLKITADINKEVEQNTFLRNSQAKMARPAVTAPLSSIHYNALSGRIKDEKNNPVPYVIISNSKENLVVAADSAGRFTMLTPDTILSVEISSVGFENSNSFLQGKKMNNIVLKESTAALNEVVVTGYGTSKKKALNESPEPITGWEKYFQYLDENKIIPGIPASGQEKGIVELSFSINKKGIPENIKMVKTDCIPCTPEAIRLVKEGPGWKIIGRNNQVKLQVSFISK